MVLNLLHLFSPPPFTRHVFHPSPPVCSSCVLRKLTSMPCLLDSAWVWPVRSTSRRLEGKGQKESEPGYLLPGSLSLQRCHGLVRCLYCRLLLLEDGTFCIAPFFCSSASSLALSLQVRVPKAPTVASPEGHTPC